MTQIEKLIEQIRVKSDHYQSQDFYDYSIEDIIQQYAEEYAKKCLEIAAKNVQIISQSHKPNNKSFEEDSECDLFYTFDEYSITNITLPSHE